MIDAMFRGGPAGATPPPASVPNGFNGSFNNVVSSATAAEPTKTSSVATESLTSHLTMCTNPSHFKSLLETHRCVVANFTNERGCPPCRAIAPHFERIAREVSLEGSPLATRSGRVPKTREMEFAVIDTTVGGDLAQQYGIRATPTFKFFIEGKEVRRVGLSWLSNDGADTNILQVAELKGANPNELQSQVDLALFSAYPRKTLFLARTGSSR